MHMHIVHALDLAISLRKWPVLRKDDCSGSDKHPLMAAVETIKLTFVVCLKHIAAMLFTPFVTKCFQV